MALWVKLISELCGPFQEGYMGILGFYKGENFDQLSAVVFKKKCFWCIRLAIYVCVYTYTYNILEYYIEYYMYSKI